jgi:hypothetical protein
LIGNYHFAHDYGCVHPGMPLGRKHLRRSRDAPTGGIGHTQRADSRLGAKPSEVNGLMREGDPKVQQVASTAGSMVHASGSSLEWIPTSQTRRAVKHTPKTYSGTNRWGRPSSY